MRIRKSVPEGYKTKSSSLTTTSAKTRTLSATARSSSGTGKPDAQAQVQARGHIGERRRAVELMPFCGLHKVGNLAVQESSLAGKEEEEDDLPPLVFEDIDAELQTSSQESNESVRTVGPFAFYGSVRAVGGERGRGNKRIWEEGDEDRDQDVGDGDGDGSAGEERRDMDVGVGLRPIAQPKTRRSTRRRDAVKAECTWKEGMESGEEERKEWAEEFRVEEWMDVDF